MAIIVKQNLVNSTKWDIKCPYSMNPQYICVHNTANDASAANEISYMISNNNQVSFHIAVDEKEAIQGIPLNRNAWAAGDGASGTGNRKAIHIEICYSKSGGWKFEQAEKNAAKLIAQMLAERGWGIERVKTHKDFSGKNCPHRTLSIGWASFLNMVKHELKLIQDSKVYYRVVVGSYLDKTAAEKAVQELKNKGYSGTFIATYKPE